MKLLTGLFRLARKRTQTADTDAGDFRGRITELVDKKDSIPDDEIGSKVEELKSMCQDLPESDDKGKLDRFLEDFKSLKEQDGATAKEAASMVADLFEKLDTEAMKDAPETAAAETETPPPAEQKDGAEKEDAPQAKDTGSEAETAPEAESAGSGQSLEEIWQYIKKKLAEDSDGKTEQKEKEEEKTESVADHAPRIPVTMNGGAPSEGSIGAMFERIKNGGR